MSDEITPISQPVPPDPNSNDGSRASDAAVVEQIAGTAAVAVIPRTGDEATWVFPVEGIRPLPNFGSWPVSAPYVDPDARQRIRDVIAATLIALICAIAAGLYVAGVYGSEHPPKPPPSQTQDPFAVGTSSGGGLP